MQNLDANDPAAQLDWQRVRPVLDEVIGELGEGEREAILLRFFEGRDYTSIGAKLNLAANTARMRVERALDKLRERLERRGLRSTSAALATALAQQAVVAAPAGLAATVTGAALAGGTALAGAALVGTTSGTATVAAGASFMSITKLQIGLASAVAIAGATGFVVQAETNESLRREIATLRTETAAIETLKTENRQLARQVVQTADMRTDDAEFGRLQEEATTLRTRLQQVAKLEQQRAAALANSVYDISTLDRAPAPRFQARPQYPADMRAAGITGEVVVDFLVDTNGDVQKAYAARSSQREFESAAVDAVNKWKFKPGQKTGRDVNTHMQVPIVFSLDGVGAKSAPPGPATTKQEAVKLSPFNVQAK